MAYIVTNINDACEKGTIQVYAVRYKYRNKKENCAISLPGNLDTEFKKEFCDNIKRFASAKETVFDPLLDGLEDGTYEYIHIKNVKNKCDEINNLMNHCINYYGESKNRVGYSNLFICNLKYENHQYLLCARQKKYPNSLLKGKTIILSRQDKLMKVNQGEIFFLSPYVGFIIDTYEEKILIFDKKDFVDIFKYDEYQKENVKKHISIIDEWPFLSSTQLIKDKCSLKKVYGNLAKVFDDERYLQQIKNTNAADLKKHILNRCSGNFSEEDFDGDKIKVTEKNLDKVMRMLAKRFKFNFFTQTSQYKIPRSTLKIQ